MPSFISSNPSRIGALVGAAMLLGSPAAAEEQPAGRFTMTPAEGGFIRLDTQTGAMSVCKGQEGSWNCTAMPDDQKSLQDRLAKIEEENRTLREENKRLEAVLGLGGDKPKEGAEAPPQDGGAPTSPGQGFKLPSDKDVDKAFDYVEGLLKKFRDRLKKLEDQNKDGKATPL